MQLDVSFRDHSLYVLILGTCYGASSGALGEDSATLGELGGRVGELAEDSGGLGRGC